MYEKKRVDQKGEEGRHRAQCARGSGKRRCVAADSRSLGLGT